MTKVQILEAEIQSLREENAKLRAALRESQDWNWITAHEYMEENKLTKYPIDEMQALSDLAEDVD